MYNMVLNIKFVSLNLFPYCHFNKRYFKMKSPELYFIQYTVHVSFYFIASAVNRFEGLKGTEGFSCEP